VSWYFLSSTFCSHQLVEANEVGISQFRSRFRAIFSDGGTPFQGTFEPDNNFKYPGAVLLTGKTDAVVPLDGLANASSYQYYWYYSWNFFVNKWTQLNSCKLMVDAMATPFAAEGVECVNYQNCQSPVIACTWPGGHVYENWHPKLMWWVWNAVTGANSKPKVPTWYFWGVIIFSMAVVVVSVTLTIIGMCYYHHSQTSTTSDLWYKLQVEQEEI